MPPMNDAEPKWIALARNQAAVLPVLWTMKWSSPETTRMDDTSYLLALIANGWCLAPACTEAPLHCHWPESPVAREVRKLTEETNL